MSKLSTWILSIALASAANPSYAWDTFEQQTFAKDSPEIKVLCVEMKQKTWILLDGKEICEVSTDGGKTWKIVWLGVLWLGGLITWWILIRRKNKAIVWDEDSWEEPIGWTSSEEWAGEWPTWTEGSPWAESSDERSEEPMGWAAPWTEDTEYKSVKSKWEGISQDIRYNINDAHNAKQLLRRLVSKYSAGHWVGPTPEETANSTFLNKLMWDLRSTNELTKRIAIQTIFAVGTIEWLTKIPEPIL